MNEDEILQIGFIHGIAIGTLLGMALIYGWPALKEWIISIVSAAKTLTRLAEDRDAPIEAAAARIRFQGQATVRQEEFVVKAQQMGLERENALELYKASGAAASDVVTGFDKAQDRKPTVERAIQRVKTTPDRAFYVEVDIRNLGGLNAKLGHTKADRVYGTMARITERYLLNLEADVSRFRHGGDEFSFVIVSLTVTKENVEAALKSASEEIQEYVAKEGLAEIEHPKHKEDQSKRGTGIVFGVSQIIGEATVEEVLSAADVEVERRKLAQTVADRR